MADRLLMEAGKLVVSKEGKDASDPLLTPGDMLFNSDWLFSGTIIAAGLVIDSASYRNTKQFDMSGFRSRETTDSTFSQVVDFPPLSYIPTVLLIPLGDSRYWNDFGLLLLGNHKQWSSSAPREYRPAPITVTNSQIIIPRLHVDVSPYFKYREDFIYVVMGM